MPRRTSSGVAFAKALGARLTLKSLRTVVVIAAVSAVVSCRDSDVDLVVTVTVPAEIPSISSGVLRLSLWSYDPMLADAPAMLADADSVRFSHSHGAANTFRMRVHRRVPGGLRTYITVRGFEFAAECEKYVLWDGIEGSGMPSNVVMRAVSTPTCVQ